MKIDSRKYSTLASLIFSSLSVALLASCCDPGRPVRAIIIRKYDIAPSDTTWDCDQKVLSSVEYVGGGRFLCGDLGEVGDYVTVWLDSIGGVSAKPKVCE